MLKFLLCISGVLFISTASKSYASEASSADKKSAVKMDMSRSLYLKKIKMELQKSLCTESGLLNCFKISRSDCLQTVGSYFGPCAKQQAIPETVSLAGEDLVLAETLGACVSEKLGEKFKHKFNEASECATRK